jgi:RNA polymerase sigma-70 factor (ECF subfamily)
MTTSAIPGQTGASTPAQVRQCVAELWSRSGAKKYAIGLDAWTEILQKISGKYLPAGSGTEAEVALYQSLRLEELALARACAAGNDDAWAEFLTRYRAKLYEVAYGIARNETTGRDLADSLYAELYGLRERGEERVSKLNYYMGRGSLEGWLRTVLAQDYVNRYRSSKHTVSLEEKLEAGEQFEAAEPQATTGDTRLEHATDAALAGCSNEERLLLAAYYLDGRTLAEIARLSGVHESTISRKLDRLAKSLRERIIKELRRGGASKRQAEELLETDVRDLQVNVRKHLAQETRGSPFYE